MLQETISQGRPGPKLAGLCRPAELGVVHRRRPCGVGPAVRAPGRAARQPRDLAVPRRDRPAQAVAPRRARRRRAERDPEPAHRLAHGRGARAGSRRRLLRDAERAGVPGRQFHPHARAARLSRGARLLPRHVRPYPDARAPRLCRDDAAYRRAGIGGDRGGRRGTRRRGSTGTASSSGWRRRMASSRSSAPASPRASANRISAWRATRSSGCPSRSSARSTRPTSTTPSSRAIWCRESLEQTIADVLALTPERLLAL